MPMLINTLMVGLLGTCSYFPFYLFPCFNNFIISFNLASDLIFGFVGVILVLKNLLVF